MSIDRVAEAISAVPGGQVAVAKKLTDLTGIEVKQSRISMWFFRGVIPPNWVIPLETVLGGKPSRYDIRPDLYPRDHAA